MVKDLIPGGLADKSKKKFNKQQLEMGAKVEMEHTNNPALAKEIAKDHLTEDPKYYNKLKKIEKAHKFASIFSKLASEYDFKTKMKINKLVIEEIARESGFEKDLKSIAIGLVDSPIHSLVQELADSIHQEAERLKSDFSFVTPVPLSSRKTAQVNTPNVTIQPGRPEANCALEILKRWKPDYFVGVASIVIGPSADYGHVESGPEKDPSVIYINADRIIAESGGVQQGRAAALACAKVIAHEKGHVASFKPELGFEGGEGPAEAQEQEFENWLNSGGMQQVESLPCFSQMS